MAGKTVTNLHIQAQEGVERTYFASWSFGESHVDSYSYEWQYLVNSTWFEGSSGSTAANVKNCIYQAPENAVKIRVRVKPISKTYKKKVKKKQVETKYFSSSWSGYKDLAMPSSTVYYPEDIAAPTVTIDRFTLTASVETYDTNTKSVKFEIVKDGSKVIETLEATVSFNKASVHTTHIVAGGKYKVRCRGVNTVVMKRQVKDGQRTIWVPDPDVDPLELDRYVRNPGHYPANFGKKQVNQQLYKTVSDSDTLNGNWSQYSQEVSTIPARVLGSPKAVAKSINSIELVWNRASAATSYEIEYTTDRRNFDINPDAVTSITSDTTKRIVSIDGGAEYFFRIRGVNSQCSEDFKPEWSAICSCRAGQKPNPPTTWSDLASVSVGEDVVLYWTHNSADNSRERDAVLSLTINGQPDPQTYSLPNPYVNDPDSVDPGTYSWTLKTSEAIYQAGATVTWSVKTRGAINAYSDPSVERTITIYAPPTLNISLGDGNRWYWNTFDFYDGDIRTAKGDVIPLVDNELHAYPLYVQLESGPTSQVPVSYYVSIVAEDTYEDRDDLGNYYTVNAGDEVFSKYYDVSDYNHVAYVGPDNSNFESGHYYTINATVAMDSGLTAETTASFYVVWEEDDFDIGITDWFIIEDTIAASFKPYCNDADGIPIENVRLTIYRREFDGSFVEVASEVDNLIQPTIVDPHPSLNYGRYRIVAKSEDTGRVKFYDTPPEEIGETSIILQWNETYRPFIGEEELDGEDISDLGWAGSFLRLPYNVDISESNDKDVAHVEYIGRRHPVSYYGTQVGQKGSWKAVIDKYDYETILSLRRLAVYMGDVYVREPSGIGYWATVSVSMSREHLAVTMPITIEVTRVEGGM